MLSSHLHFFLITALSETVTILYFFNMIKNIWNQLPSLWLKGKHWHIPIELKKVRERDLLLASMCLEVIVTKLSQEKEKK